MTDGDPIAGVISEAARRDLERAVMLLENPSFMARVTDVVGRPVERLVGALPRETSAKLQQSVRAVLYKLLDLSVSTMGGGRQRPAAMRLHKAAVGMTGAVGGFFGLPALAVELPVTTTVMLRSIADIARSEGEDLATLPSRLACLEVFALGGRAGSDDSSETGYFAVRAALAKAVSDATRHIAERGLTQEGAPAIARLIAQIASRFGSVVSEKTVAQAVPLIGAIGGAGINLLFVGHFQDIARGHFIVRRLERTHGAEPVQTAYRELAERLATELSRRR